MWLLFIFHLDLGHSTKAKIRPPKNKNKKTGVFATWSPHRPNPIGLSIAKIEKVGDGYLHISGIDLVDQTPIIDIKPYIDEDYIAWEHQGLPDWIEEAKEERIEVNFLKDSEEQIKHFSKHSTFVQNSD